MCVTPFAMYEPDENGTNDFVQKAFCRCLPCVNMSTANQYFNRVEFLINEVGFFYA